MSRLNLPPQLMGLNDVSKRQMLVVGHENLLHVNALARHWFFDCRKEEPHLPYGMDVSTFLVHVVRAGLQFRPDPAAGDPSIGDVLAATGMDLDTDHLLGVQFLVQRRDFGSRLLSGQDADGQGRGLDG